MQYIDSHEHKLKRELLTSLNFIHYAAINMDHAIEPNIRYPPNAYSYYLPT